MQDTHTLSTASCLSQGPDRGGQMEIRDHSSKQGAAFPCWKVPGGVRKIWVDPMSNPVTVMALARGSQASPGGVTGNTTSFLRDWGRHPRSVTPRPLSWHGCNKRSPEGWACRKAKSYPQQMGTLSQSVPERQPSQRTTIQWKNTGPGTGTMNHRRSSVCVWHTCVCVSVKHQIFSSSKTCTEALPSFITTVLHVPNIFYAFEVGCKNVTTVSRQTRVTPISLSPLPKGAFVSNECFFS